MTRTFRNINLLPTARSTVPSGYANHVIVPPTRRGPPMLDDPEGRVQEWRSRDGPRWARLANWMVPLCRTAPAIMPLLYEAMRAAAQHGERNSDWLLATDAFYAGGLIGLSLRSHSQKYPVTPEMVADCKYLREMVDLERQDARKKGETAQYAVFTALYYSFREIRLRTRDAGLQKGIITCWKSLPSSFTLPIMCFFHCTSDKSFRLIAIDLEDILNGVFEEACEFTGGGFEEESPVLDEYLFALTWPNYIRGTASYPMPLQQTSPTSGANANANANTNTNTNTNANDSDSDSDNDSTLDFQHNFRLPPVPTSPGTLTESLRTGQEPTLAGSSNGSTLAPGMRYVQPPANVEYQQVTRSIGSTYPFSPPFEGQADFNYFRALGQFPPMPSEYLYKDPPVHEPHQVYRSEYTRRSDLGPRRSPFTR